MSSLKFPLRVLPGYKFLTTMRWAVVDADNQPIELTKHQGEVIVAALEADAEKELNDV